MSEQDPILARLDEAIDDCLNEWQICDEQVGEDRCRFRLREAMRRLLADVAIEEYRLHIPDQMDGFHGQSAYLTKSEKDAMTDERAKDIRARFGVTEEGNG